MPDCNDNSLSFSDYTHLAQRILLSLCGIRSPSGFEGDLGVAAALTRAVSAVTSFDEAAHTPVGNHLFRRAAKAPAPGVTPPRVLLDAHFDEIALMVRRIDEDGWIFASPLGGIDPRALAGERFFVLAKKAEIPLDSASETSSAHDPWEKIPAVCCPPPDSPRDGKTSPGALSEWKNFPFFAGLPREELTSRGVTLGCSIVFASEPIVFSNRTEKEHSAAIPDGDDTTLTASRSSHDEGAKNSKSAYSVANETATENHTDSVPAAGTRVISHSLDNKAGCAAILLAAKMLEGIPLACDLDLLFSSGEETHMTGARSLASPAPQVAIVVDTDFGAAPGLDEKITAPLGGGPTVTLSVQTDRRLTQEILGAADENCSQEIYKKVTSSDNPEMQTRAFDIFSGKIPHKRVVWPDSTGTNAAALGFAAGGARTAVVSVPIKAMHTPREMLDPADIVTTAQLLARFIAKNYTGFTSEPGEIAQM